MASFKGIRVSHEWRVILLEAWHDGVRFQLNDGQRTIAIQWERVRKHGLYGPNNPHGAAYPNANAPHIKHGAPNHALDVDSAGNGENELQAWLAHHGCAAVNNVSTESWHLDPVNLGQFMTLFRRCRARQRARRWPTLKHKGGHNRPAAVKRLQRWLRAAGYVSVRVTGKYDVLTRRAVKKFKRKHGLKADTVCGPACWKALDRVIHR
jgi:hypothetical protein